jgi:hypothetical protein
LSRIIGNQVAVHHATRVHHQSHQIAQQNMLRQQMMNRQLLLQLCQEVVATPATVEDIQALVEITRTAEPQGLDFAQVVARIRESTPFTGLVQLLPKDRAELYALLAVFVAVLQLLMSQGAPRSGCHPGPGGADHRAGHRSPAVRAATHHGAGLQVGSGLHRGQEPDSGVSTDSGLPQLAQDVPVALQALSVSYLDLSRIGLNVGQGFRPLKEDEGVEIRHGAGCCSRDDPNLYIRQARH